MYLIFSTMQKENQTIAGATFTDNFAFRFVGCLISYDKRLFETLHNQFKDYGEMLLTTNYMDDLEDRMEFFAMLDMLDELRNATIGLSDKELTKEFQQVVKLLTIPKESEVANA